MPISNVNMKKFTYAAKDLESLFSDTSFIIASCTSRWSGNTGPVATTRNVNAPHDESSGCGSTVMAFSSVLTKLRRTLTDMRTLSPTNDALRQLASIHFGTQKLKRKLERLIDLISGQIKTLTPHLLSFADEGFLASLPDGPATKAYSIDQNPLDLELEVLKIMTSGIIAGESGHKLTLKNRVKAAFSLGKRRKKRILKSYQDRLLQMEAQNGESNFRKLTCEGQVDPSNLILTWNPEKLEFSQESNPDEIELLDSILSEADAKYFSDSLPAVEKDDILNKNDELQILLGPSPLFSKCSMDDDAQNENAKRVSCAAGLEGASIIMDLIRVLRTQIEWVTTSVRNAERGFYLLPKSLLKATAECSELELKDIVEIVAEAGAWLNAEMSRSNKDAGNLTPEHLELMTLLGKALRSGVCCLGEFQSLVSIVRSDANELETAILEPGAGGRQLLEDDDWYMSEAAKQRRTTGDTC